MMIFTNKPNLSTKVQRYTLHGFTLAEVLITLGIIGVVAAMTIPTVMHNYKKHLIETQLKTAFQLFNDATKSSEVENGFPEQWNKGEFNDAEYIDKYLKILKKCASHTTSAECRRDVYSYNGQNYINNNTAAYPKTVLVNGLGYQYLGQPQDGYYGFIQLDLNITKGPKQVVGVDAFTFTMPSALNWNFGGTYQIYSKTTAQACSLIKTDSAYKQSFYNKCDDRTGFNSYGLECAIIIECNNWEIPNDYPIKF